MHGRGSMQRLYIAIIGRPYISSRTITQNVRAYVKQATLYRNMKLARVLVQNGCSCHPTLELPFASAFTEAMSMGFGAKRAAKKAAKRSHQYTV